MPNQNSAKGNPASKRMSNPALKIRRSLSWQRAQKRHEANRKTGEQRAKANKEALQVFPVSAQSYEMGSQTKSRKGGGDPARPSKMLRYIRREKIRAEKQRG